MEKPKFNIVDLLIIVVVITVIAAGVYIISSKKEGATANDNKKVTVEFVIEETNVDSSRKETYETLAKKGDVITFGEKEKITGTLKEVDSEPAKMVFDDPKTGERTWVEKIDVYDIKFVFEAELDETETDFLAGSSKVKVGKSLVFSGKGYAGSGIIIGVEKKGADANDK